MEQVNAQEQSIVMTSQHAITEVVIGLERLDQQLVDISRWLSLLPPRKTAAVATETLAEHLLTTIRMARTDYFSELTDLLKRAVRETEGSLWLAHMAEVDVEQELALSGSGAIIEYLARRYHRSDQEVMGCLYLNACNRLIANVELFRGTKTGILADRSLVFREGLRRAATGLVLWHTHPLDPTPSTEDEKLTMRFIGAAELVGLQVIDHLVIGSDGRWCSIKSRLKN